MKLVLVIGIIGLSLMASCSACNPSGSGNQPGNANGNGNSNNPLAVATPPPELTASSTLDPNFKECNSYFPLIPGSQARYSLQYSAGLQANVVAVVDKTDEGGTTVFVQKLQILDKSGGLNKNEMTVQKYVCDKARIKIIAESRDNSVEGRRTIMDVHYVDPAYAMLEPAALKPGATWSYSFTQTFQGSDYASTTSDQPRSFSFTVEGEEDLTVPAGKFRVIKVTKATSKINIFEYFARGVGLVKRVNADGTTWELLSYSGLKPGT